MDRQFIYWNLPWKFLGTKWAVASFTLMFYVAIIIQFMKSTLTTTMFKHPSSMFLGMTTRATLNRLLENGNISSEEFGKVYNAAHHYFRDSYI